MSWFARLASTLWHAPGRAWAGMLRAGPLSVWLTAGAAMAWTLVSVGYVVLFRPDLTSDQAFWIIMAAHGLVMLSLAALTMTELRLKAGRAGVELDIGQGERPSAVITTQTTVETTAAPTDSDAPPWERKP